MSQPVRLGMIGFGAVGSAVESGIHAGAAGEVRLIAILTRSTPIQSPSDRSVALVRSLGELLDMKPDVVIDAATNSALAAYGAHILEAGCDLVTVNAAWIAHEGALDRLLTAAAAGNSRLLLPSGAISGLDWLAAATLIGVDRVVHVVRKPPEALLSNSDAAAVRHSGRERVLFHGPAREAARRFPENVNVVVLVSMAGIGLDDTEAVVVADPDVTRNTHEVTVESPCGRVTVRVQNQPTPGHPKTGLVVAGSVLRTIRRLREPLVIGA